MPVPPIRFSYVSGDGQQIAAYRWDPPGPPVAAMQLTHGMGEHALRYDQLALALNRKGLVVYAGLTDVTVRVYQGARHEILNETNNAEVISDLTEWVDRVLAGHGHAVS